MPARYKHDFPTGLRFIRFILWPFSLLYGAVIGIRNILFDVGILPQFKPPVPVVVVGNIRAGGTGKTSMIIWLAKRLDPDFKIAILSRGYGRRSSGFLRVLAESDPILTGDEPLEIKQALPHLQVAVDGNRKRGILQLMQSEDPPNLILMDDGFQHRFVKPAFSIVLSDYQHPPIKDYLLPMGRLREPVSALKRADLIITTKVPAGQSTGRLFSTLGYKEPVRMGTHSPQLTWNQIVEEHWELWLLTGIANPEYLLDALKSRGITPHWIRYPDHFRYTSREVDHIMQQMEQHPAGKKLLISTRKDATKLSKFSDFQNHHVYLAEIFHLFTTENEERIISKLYEYIQ